MVVIMNKQIKYDSVLAKTKSIFSGKLELSSQAKMSLVASMLHKEFSHWIFCGFYVRSESTILEIGPYSGNIIPCTHITEGRGVCGTSMKEKRTIIVDDVSSYANYISCDSKTESEIVVPIIKNNLVISVLDIDSPNKGEFDNIDKNSLMKISSIV
ncbi:MAG: GAF domain-containing protein [Candidatus Marinimicrobia bacterium]|nr:GAF domain-containing protein [Candidatus Neomarinimicrobiota bacterium]|tara:strand:- start:2206 stop:2673 length:468 start_codon:yes stop_codon:yes gene_type:complete